MKTPFAFAAAAAAMIAAIPASAYTAGRPAGADNLDQGYATDAYPGFEELGVKDADRKSASWWYSVKRETPSEQFGYALELENAGYLKKAAGAYEALVREWPASLEAAEAQRRKAGILTRQHEFQEAFDEYEYLLRFYPGLCNYALVAKLEYGLACAMATEDTTFLGLRLVSNHEVRRCFEKAVRRAPGADWAPDAMLKIAELRAEDDDCGEAIAVYENIVSRYPGTRQALQALFQACRLRYELVGRKGYNEGRCRNALNYIRAALERQPDHPYAGEMKDWQTALERKLEDDAWSRAVFYDTRQRTQKSAVSAYEQFLVDYPETSRRAEAEARIEAIKGGAAPLRK